MTIDLMKGFTHKLKHNSILNRDITETLQKYQSINQIKH